MTAGVTSPIITTAGEPQGDALGTLLGLLQADMDACGRAIVARMDSPVALIPQLAAHIVAAGGKRLRPLLTLAAARMCGYASGHRHINLAACVEFIHTATLLHDDVVDESRLRRGMASANAVFDNKAPVLVGDFMFTRAFQLMIEDGSLHVLRILCNAAATIAEGEVLQLVTQHDLATTEDRYLDVVRGKTAALFAAAAQVGAVVAQRPVAEEDALATYGLNLGIAFQLVDDALDYAADEAVLGKSVGDDFREGKITLPVLIAYQKGSPEERQFWRRTLEEGQQQDEDLPHAMRLLKRHEAIDTTLGRAANFVREAQEALEIFPQSPLRQALIDVGSYTVNRVH
ncbi:MAG: polyprenyl synthetase family protein [Proteobacteria bacterium]|nr:polyprenyl synthetase family protein [Pseudomonadota bacterium]